MNLHTEVFSVPHHTHTNTHTKHQQQRDRRTPTDVSLLIFTCLSLSLLSLCLLELCLFLFPVSCRLSLIARSVGSLCTHGPICGPWPIPCPVNMFASCKKLLSEDSCASLVPLGMKWACICPGKKNVLGVVWCDVSVLCVFVCVAM